MDGEQAEEPKSATTPSLRPSPVLHNPIPTLEYQPPTPSYLPDHDTTSTFQMAHMSDQGHSRNQESFSRSRISTGAGSDTSNVEHMTDEAEAAWSPSSAPQESVTHAVPEDVDAAFSGIGQHTQLEPTSGAPEVEENREALDTWAEQNAFEDQAPAAIPLPSTSQDLEADPNDSQNQQRDESTQPVSRSHSPTDTPEDLTHTDQRPSKATTTTDGSPSPQDARHNLTNTHSVPHRSTEELATALGHPAEPSVPSDAQDTPSTENADQTRQNFASSDTPVQSNPDAHVVDLGEERPVQENVQAPFSPIAQDDAWAQALGTGTDGDLQSTVAPSAHELTFSQPDANAGLAITDIEAEPENETVHELTEGLMDPLRGDASPAAPEQAGFSDAIKEVSGDLDASKVQQDQLPGDKDTEQEAVSNWMGSDAQESGLDDSWEKAFAAPVQASNDPSWESAFGEDLDEDGFLEDDAGFLDGNTAPSDFNPLAESARSPQTVAANPYAPQTTSSPFPDPTPFQQSAPAPVQTNLTSSDRAAPGGMKFFEDLPMTQPIRAKKPRQIVPNVSPPAVAPPPGGRFGSSQPPQRQLSSGQPAYQQQLVGPGKLDMFPPQPSHSQQLPPNISSTSSSSPHAPSLQPPVNTNSRYSPAPSQPTSTSSRYAVAPPPAPPTPNSRYSLAPSQSSASHQPPPSGPYGQPGSHNDRAAPSPNSFFPQQQAQTSTTLAGAPTPSTRYSPAPSNMDALPNDKRRPPPPAPPPSMSTQRFIPRTSSPLRPAARPQVDRSHTMAVPPQSNAEQPLPSLPSASESGPPLQRSTTQSNYAPQTPATQSSTSLPLEPLENLPQRRQQPLSFEPPRRPRTQSPENVRSRFAPMPASFDRKQSHQDATATSLPPLSRVPVPFTTTGPSVSDNLNFVQPTDPAQASDPLTRWKGSPSVHWCPGGSLAVHFPKHVPRYGGGQTAPAMKCSPGEIKIQRVKESMPIDEALRTFPGPLRSKSKKKELLPWLSSRIESLQRDLSTTQMTSMDPRTGERLLLWQVMRVLVENDGMLNGNTSVDSAVRQLFSTSFEQRGTIRNDDINDTISRTDKSSLQTVQDIRQHLLHGDREKAVWQAVDNKLWGHAMLISSTMGGILWKQVAQEFVRVEVRSSTQDNKSLAALYAVFAHNWDESIDELVPASARAGFQMVPTSGTFTHLTNTIDGLNKWQETLGLVLSNRSSEDEKGLIALGKLLRGYGRIEAAHVCFLFSRSVLQLSGLDDPEAHFTLLGAEVGAGATQDIDAILLSEVYEFSTSLSSSSASHYIPHLQAYKLYHAHALADGGYRTEALQYCDAVSSAIKSTTRPSPYYHPALITQLDDLTKRLSQSPKDSSSSRMSKPTIGKMSSGMWAKFNNFVAGDDDAASTGSGQPSEAESGPFSRFTGGTPTISRSASSADMSAFTPMPPVSGNPRYAPTYGGPIAANTYHQASAPRDIPRAPGSSHSDFRPSLRSDSFQPPQSTYNPAYNPSHHLGIADNMSQASSSYEPSILQPQTAFMSEHPYGSSPTTHSSRAASSHGPPSIPAQDQEMSVIDEEGPAPKMNGYSPAMNGYAPSSHEATYASPPNHVYDPQNPASVGGMNADSPGAYDPSSGSGYEPPSGGYQPYEPNSPTSPTSPKKPRAKKKSFMDDDDDNDIQYRAATSRSGKQPAAQSREPDDAVRRAAEADGKYSLSLPMLMRLSSVWKSQANKHVPQMPMTKPPLKAKSPHHGSRPSASSAAKPTPTPLSCTKPSSAKRAPSTTTLGRRNG